MHRAPRYAGRRASLATKHDKIGLVGPAMREETGLEVFPVCCDTDALGTFSGEVERRLPPLETAVAKARMGMAASGARLGLASEGSINSVGFLPLVTDVELVVLVDDEEGFVLAEVCESRSLVAHSWTLDGEFPDEDDLHRAGFPEHGLIVHPEGAVQPVLKGIHGREGLQRAIDRCREQGHGTVRVRSDFRAHHSPSRRPAIEEAARRLARRLTVPCPVCDCPGWGPVDVVTGRRCAACGAPTRGRIANVFGCPRCPERMRGPELGTPADPSTCGNCNP